MDENTNHASGFSWTYVKEYLMALWDEIKKSTSETFENARKKAQEATEVSHLRQDITREQSKISDLYRRIGELYVLQHHDNPEEGFADWIQEIDASNAQIADYEERIREVRGVAVCPNCGREVEAGTNFCAWCGTQLPKIEPKPEGKVCPACATVNAEDAAFCKNCGHSFVQELPAPKEEAAQIAAPQETAPAASPELAKKPEPAPAQSAAEPAAPTPEEKPAAPSEAPAEPASAKPAETPEDTEPETPAPTEIKTTEPVA